jgi:pantoate--beta-alanine ligase
MPDTLKLWNHLAAWRDHRRSLAGRTIGFVPTMGALHRGHAALVERCRAENEVAVVSIFVNPSQFNDPKDLERYPRTLSSDLELLERLGVDHVLHPPPSELYPDGYRFRVEADRQTQIMEGAARPGFLQGVMTIVLKLLNLVGPRRAYFGEKDYQQLKTLTEMVSDLFLPTEIVACPTVRDPSGLAESSRNALLSSEARRHAALLYRVLTTAPGPTEAAQLLEAGGFAVDYVEEHWGRRFAAVFLEGIRLIDNVPIKQASGER